MPNAVLTCRLCAHRFDKGVPADKTQDDSTFVCEPCSVKHSGYPQNGWINPLVLRFDQSLGPPKEEAAAPAKPWLKRILGK